MDFDIPRYSDNTTKNEDLSRIWTSRVVVVVVRVGSIPVGSELTDIIGESKKKIKTLLKITKYTSFYSMH